MAVVITLKAPAKLNLTLEVIQRHDSGYHSIRSVVVKLDNIADTIDLRIDRAGNGVHVTTDSDEIPRDERNVCHQAAARFLETIGATARVDIHIGKIIPVSAGLGGGSTDAAAVMLGLNREFGNPMSSDALSLVGAQIGKDIPLFLARCPAAVISGLGERVDPLPASPECRFVIVNPRIPISTPEAYASLARTVCFMSDEERADVTGAMALAMRSGDRHAVAARLYNDFEPAIERRHPVVKELKQALLAFGAAGALMSGSGPTVFGLFESAAQGDVAERALRRYYPSFIVRGG